MSKKRAREDRERVQADAAEQGSLAAAGKRYKGGDEEAALMKNNMFKELTPQQASRLIYPNPVCFLTTVTPTGKLNAMTLSWLAPANNYGGLVFVIHKTRFSAACLLERKEFMLSVASAAQVDVLLECGKFTGSTKDKLDGSIAGLSARTASTAKQTANNAFSALQDSDDDSDDDAEAAKKLALDADSSVGDFDLVPIAGTVATMKCKVLSHTDGADAGHWVVVAQIETAHVHPQYWDGKVFGPTNNSLPPLVSFLGSQQFGATQIISSTSTAAASGEDEVEDISN
jgi:flavin reductase (DIM6/NTAB) family NADH-FMN oxidoreductase RutF